MTMAYLVSSALFASGRESVCEFCKTIPRTYWQPRIANEMRHVVLVMVSGRLNTVELVAVSSQVFKLQLKFGVLRGIGSMLRLAHKVVSHLRVIVIEATCQADQWSKLREWG